MTLDYPPKKEKKKYGNSISKNWVGDDRYDCKVAKDDLFHLFLSSGVYLFFIVSSRILKDRTPRELLYIAIFNPKCCLLLDATRWMRAVVH